MAIAAPFQPGVVLSADAGQKGEFVTPEAGDPTPPAIRDADLVRSYQFSASPQVFADAVYTHATNGRPRLNSLPGPRGVPLGGGMATPLSRAQTPP